MQARGEEPERDAFGHVKIDKINPGNWFAKRFADMVNEKAAGKLKIDLHQGGTLGVKDVDMLRILPAGNVIQIAGLYPGYMTRDVPEYASTLPPGVVKEPAKMVGPDQKWLTTMGYLEKVDDYLNKALKG